jgi:hypothetical protein
MTPFIFGRSWMLGYVSLFDHTPIETRYRGSWFASSVDAGVVFVGWLPYKTHTT